MSDCPVYHNLKMGVCLDVNGVIVYSLYWLSCIIP